MIHFVDDQGVDKMEVAADGPNPNDTSLLHRMLTLVARKMALPPTQPLVPLHRSREDRGARELP